MKMDDGGEEITALHMDYIYNGYIFQEHLEVNE